MQAMSCDAQVPSSNSLRMSMPSTQAGRKSGSTRRIEPGAAIAKAPTVFIRPKEASAPSLILQMENLAQTEARLASEGRVEKHEDDKDRTEKADEFQEKESRPSFYSPFKNIIKNYKKQISKSEVDDEKKNSLLARLDNAHLAHRMSYEDIRSKVEKHTLDSKEVDSMIKALTIPSRPFGKWPAGYDALYEFVKTKGVEKKLLIKLLNSIPFNLRPGDGNTNSSIGASFDPNLDASGRNTPLSQSLSSYGEKNPGSLTPSKDYKAEKHKRPMNIGSEIMPSVASSTSLTISELQNFEKFVCDAMEAVIRGTFAGACHRTDRAKERKTR